MASEQHLIIDVYGRVQGVGFRYHTCRRANALGLCGEVRNMPDGSVRIHLGGEAHAVEQMLAWLRHGPDPARVDRLDVRTDEQPVCRNTFVISG